MIHSGHRFGPVSNPSQARDVAAISATVWPCQVPAASLPSRRGGRHTTTSKQT